MNTDEKIVNAIFDFTYNRMTLWTILLSNFNRVPVQEGPTMKTTITKRSIDLVYNTKKIDELSISDIKTLLLHEAIHLIYRHDFRCLHENRKVCLLYEKKTKASINAHELTNEEKQACVSVADLAKDLVANRDLDYVLPTFSKHLVVRDSDLPFNFHVDNTQTTEFVAAALADKYCEVITRTGDSNGNGCASSESDNQDNNQNGGGEVNGKPINHHESTAESDTEQRIRQKMVENAIKRAVNKDGKSCGSLPGGLNSEIDIIFAPPACDWKSLLAGLVKCSIPKSSTRTWAHINRRVPYLMKGHKPKRVPCIGIAVDTSGSVSDKMLAEFFNEIDHLRKVHGSDVDIVQCDTQVEDAIHVTAKQKLPTIATGRGGTYLVPALEWFDKASRKPDVVVVFSDLEVDDSSVPEDPRSYNIIWVVTSKSMHEHFTKLNRYGTFIYMEEQQDD